MKQNLSLKLLQTIALFLFTILLIVVGILYAGVIWEAFDTLANTLNHSFRHADHYLLSFSN